MKIVTIIVKDTNTGSIAKYNHRVKSDEDNVSIKGKLNGVVFRLSGSVDDGK